MDYFPMNIAQGKAFCNRTKERHLLGKFIDSGRHTVIIAPRRYGKTSLINQTLLELNLPYVMMELTMAVTLRDVEQIVIKSVSDLLYSILPASSKAKQKILSLFKWLNPELTLSAKGQKIVFHPDWSKLGEMSSIAEILKKLDEAAGVIGKRVVIVMDEFQQLSEISDTDDQSQTSEFVIEAAIRNAMQYCQNTSYVFSGSHRQMLLSMFNNKNRPFYNSCEMMTIDRIEKSEYTSFIQNLAVERWNKPLSEDCLNKIFELTELHPHYINRLCGYFWLVGEYPILESIEKYWDQLVQSKRSEFTEDILSLSKNQRKLISHLARSPETQPSSAKICATLKISEASSRQSLKLLCSKDHVYQAKDGLYRLLDPAMGSMIRRFS